MGCDIHCCIEYASTQRPDGIFEDFYTFATVWLGRSYLLFALMAGVRNSFEVEAVASPRGLPLDVHWGTTEGCAILIDDDNAAQEGRCSRLEAERWVEAKYSFIISPHLVSDPQYHSHSWLISSELSEVQRRFRMVVKANSPRFDALVAAMHELDDGSDGRSRLVFWFDN